MKIKRERKRSLKTLWKALVVSFKIRSKLSLVVAILGFIMALLPSFTAIILQGLTNSIQKLYFNEDVFNEVVKYFSILICLFFIQQTYQYFQNLTKQYDTRAMNKYIKKKILTLKCEVDYKYIENYDNFKDKVAFAEMEAGKQMASSLQNMVTLLQALITFISVTYLLFIVSPYIVLALIVTSIPAIILSYRQKDETYIKNTKWNNENMLVFYTFYMSCGEYNLQEVRHFGLFDYIKNRWRKLAKAYCNQKNKMTTKHVVHNSIADFIRSAVYIIILFIIAYSIYENPAIGLGVFILVYSLSSRMQEVTANLLTGVVQLYGDIPYMKDFFSLDTLEKDRTDLSASILNDSSIRFSNVSFSYPNSTQKIFEGLNVSIKEGEKIAVVGENGSGKSTFVSLLCGMLKADGGTIEIGGKGIEENTAEIRNSISVVFQDFGHYEDTLRNNITISDKGRNAVDEEIIELTKHINSYDVIAEQPRGLDEQIGTFNKQTKDLSGGQWQKISIARAAYRRNAKIMILDEPTSALDPLAEAQIYRDFSSLTGNKTTILISHRLGITSVVDRILVFKDGRIIEDGNHKQLIKQNGYYAEMYQAQAQWYA